MIRKMRYFILICVLSAMTLLAGCSFIPAKSEPADTMESSEQDGDRKDDENEFAKKKKKKKAEREEAKDDTKESDEVREAFERFMEDEMKLDRVAREADFVTEQNEEGYYSEETPPELFGEVDRFFGDYDGDGDEEMLVIRICADDVYENLRLCMCEYDDGKVELSDFIEFGEDIFHADGNDSYVFQYDHDGSPVLAIMLNEMYYLTADGLNLDFTASGYDGKEFYNISGANYCGSDMEDDGGFVKALKKAGIKMKWEDVYGEDSQKKILSAADATLLAEIRTVTEKTDEEDYMPVKLYKHTTVTSYSDNALASGKDKKGGKKGNKDWTTLGEDEKQLDESVEGNDNDENDYIFPDSSERLLTEADLRGLSNEELRWARNEIAARHGRKFSDKSLQDYFDAQPWYEGSIEPDEFNKKVQLNKIELENMEFIKQHEDQ